MKKGKKGVVFVFGPYFKPLMTRKEEGKCELPLFLCDESQKVSHLDVIRWLKEVGIQTDNFTYHIAGYTRINGVPVQIVEAELSKKPGKYSDSWRLGRYDDWLHHSFKSVLDVLELQNLF